MREVTFTQFKASSVDEIKALVPAIIIFNCKPLFILAPPEGFIMTSDLHPRVRNMLHAMEKKARVGMPEAVQLPLPE